MCLRHRADQAQYGLKAGGPNGLTRPKHAQKRGGLGPVPMGSPPVAGWLTLSDPRAAEAAKGSRLQAPQGVPKQKAGLCSVSYYLRSRKFSTAWGHDPCHSLTYQAVRAKHAALAQPLKNYVQNPGEPWRWRHGGELEMYKPTLTTLSRRPATLPGWNHGAWPVSKISTAFSPKFRQLAHARK